MVNCPCPKESVAQHSRSPGPVESNEKISLIILNPDQWNDGDFSSAAFSKKKLKEGSLSVCRVKFTTISEVQRHIVTPQLLRNTNRTLFGSAVALCLDIRSINSTNRPNERIFCVIDDPIVDGPTGDYLGHALLSFSDITKGDKFWSNNDRAAALANLSLAFKKTPPPIALEDVFCESD